jgi:hypothetical protein
VGLAEDLLQQGPEGRPRRVDPGLDLALLDLEAAADPARQAHHPAVVDQTDHVEPLEQTVACGDDQPAQQRAADAPALESPLDRDRAS